MNPHMFQLENRAAVVVTAKQPFADWLNAHPLSKADKYGPTRLEIVNAEPHVYLMPYDDPENIPTLAEKSKPFFLDAILQSYFVNEEDWPQKRGSALFDQWFNLSWASMVFDLDEEKIRKEKA